MTLGQAAYRGIARLRRPSWPPPRCIVLDLSRDENGKPDGSVGPFVTQHDEGKEEQVLIFVFADEDDWEPVDVSIGETVPGSAPDQAE